MISRFHLRLLSPERLALLLLLFVSLQLFQPPRAAAEAGQAPLVPATPISARVAATNPPAFIQTPIAAPSGLLLAAGAPTNQFSLGANSSAADAQLLPGLRQRLEMARHFRHIRQPREAEPILVELLAASSPESIQKQALLELAGTATDENDLPRAQQVYAQYLSRWPNDMLVPEVLLRQGQLFRQMGMQNLALAKFYGVMTSSLVLKNDMLDYYRHLVLVAQTEIAETHFQLGKYAEAADYFARLLKQTNAALNRPLAQSRLVRCLAAVDRFDDLVAQAQDFAVRYPNSSELPEVRFHLALALKKLNRNAEALQQVLALLKEQEGRPGQNPEVWAYWQQRAGNEIGNQLYLEGDYGDALAVYLALTQLDNQITWQLPVAYQIGLTYEHLAQPEKALNSYADILRRAPEAGTNASPSLKAVLEMAKWRADFVKWQENAERAANTFTRPHTAEASSKTPYPQTATP